MVISTSNNYINCNRKVIFHEIHIAFLDCFVLALCVCVCVCFVFVFIFLNFI